jgi:hypothetical protein
VARPSLSAGRRHDLQRLRRVRASGPHPDPRRRGPGVRPGRRPRLVPGAARARARRDRVPMRPTAASRRGRLRSSTSRRSRSVRRELRARHGGDGEPSFWSPPEDATPEQLAEHEAFMAKMLVPDEASRHGWTHRRPARPQVGGDPGARDADRCRQPVHASSASTAGARGVVPARRTSSASFGWRRTTTARIRRLRRASPRRPPWSGAGHQSRSPFDASNTWPGPPCRRPPGRGSWAAPCPG